MKLPEPLLLKDAAKIINAEFIGDPEFIITGINEIHMVEKGDLTFVDHPKYYKKALNSKATTIIINSRVDCPDGKALLYCNDPFEAYVTLVRKYRGFTPSNNLISESAEIGKGTIIQPGTFIGNNVKIGENCIIHSNVSIYDYSEIGDNVIIHSNSVIGADAYYFQKKPAGYRKMESCGKVIIGNNVEIGALCAIDKGFGNTIIGDGTKLDNHVQVGHDTKIGKNCLIGSHSAIAGVTVIEDDVILWAKVAVNKDLIIGKGAVILATSGVDKNLEGNKVYFGVPVDEVRKKWKEHAYIKRLPGFFENEKIKEILS
jgi:UDP-3-O-[3-hydroxymyristoyl] glucosamine N-acyltransferase